jgi:hypothetical protein
MSSPPRPGSVDFHLDLMCPYAYQTSLWIREAHLHEIQRPKSRSDAEQIAATFLPYLQARDWVSIDRGSVVEVGSAR